MTRRRSAATCVIFFALTLGWSIPSVALGDGDFLAGDANDDGRLDIADALFIAHHLFLGAGPVTCDEALDADGNGSPAITDAVYLLNYLLLCGEGPRTGNPGPDTSVPAPSVDIRFSIGDADPEGYASILVTDRRPGG
ncbi:MAG: dockerin type I repeat-containing protein, partial [Planctomycetota bacterium]